MSNAVKRMYKEYGVEKKYMPLMNGDEVLDDKFQAYYPLTAEKQLELIKLIQSIPEINYFYSTDYVAGDEYENYRMGVSFVTEFYHEVPYGIEVISSTFDNTLAELVLKLKIYIDNAKVKEILER